MANNKIQLADGTVLLDVSNDTVDAAHLLQGYTAHDASGAPIVGTYTGGEMPSTEFGTAGALGDGSNSISFSIPAGRQLSSFILSARENLSFDASSTRVLTIAFNGVEYNAQNWSNQVGYSQTGYTTTFDGTTLTIASTNSVFASDIPYGIIYTYGALPVLSLSQYEPASGQTSAVFQNVEKEPERFIVMLLTTVQGAQWTRTAVVGYDGTDTYGFSFDNGGADFSTTAWSWSYDANAQTMTVSSQSTSVGGYFHNPGLYIFVGISKSEAGVINITENGEYDVTEYNKANVLVQGSTEQIGVATTTVTATNARSINFTVNGAPKWFALQPTGTVTNGSNSTYGKTYRMVCVIFDGTNTHGNYDASNEMYSTTAFTFTMSGNTLTINAGSVSGTNIVIQNIAYRLVYGY